MRRHASEVDLDFAATFLTCCRFSGYGNGGEVREVFVTMTDVSREGTVVANECPETARLEADRLLPKQFLRGSAADVA